jgi:LysR family glycine cleavage system transcriptional activator
MDRLPPLNPLRSFEAVGRLKSVRKAAVELAVTPGAVTRQVQALESSLGIPLFKRVPGSVMLTPRGQQYLAEIGSSLDAIRRATRKLSGRKPRDELKVRAYTTIAIKWLIPRLSSFQSANKDTEVFITTSVEDVDFRREDIDGAIRLGDGNWPGYEVDVLLPNVMIPVCSPTFQRAQRIRSVADLAGRPLLHSLARPDDWAEWLRDAAATHINPYDGPKYESSVLAYQAAIEGQGIAMANKAFVADDLRRKILVQPFGPDVDRGSFTYYLIYPRNRMRNRAFREFRRWLLEEGRFDRAGASANVG